MKRFFLAIDYRRKEAELRAIALRREREQNLNDGITAMMKVLGCSRERAAGILAGRIKPKKG